MSLLEDECFTYDSETGKLYNRITRHSRAKAGDEAGHSRKDGYSQVRVNGVRRLLSHVIWDIAHPNDKIISGEEIDHIDHDPRNNRLGNLRKVTRNENCKNYPKMKSNRSGLTGVYWGAYHNAWIAKIEVDRKNIHLYQGLDLFEASCRRKSAERKYKFHENHGAVKI